MTYVWHICVMVSLYVMLSVSLNVVVGYGGLLSMCHAAFYGIGAYTAALLIVKGGWMFLPALVAAICLNSAFAIVIGVPSLRLRGDYFVLATLGFQIIVFSVLYNWIGLTNGPNGIPGIPAPTVFGETLDTPGSFVVFSGGAALGVIFFLRHLLRSPFGRMLRAVRDDEIAAAALGKNAPAVRLIAFAVSAAMAAVPGALFAGYARFIDPTSFTIMESVFVVSIIAIGGAGNFRGPVCGAVLLVLLPELLRFLHIPDVVAANLRQILYGVALIVLMLLRPQGIAGLYRFERGAP